MARPARPAAEIAAVREAAAILSAETGVRAAQPLAKEIAARVMVELLREVDGVNADPFVAALQKAHCSPFFTLATCPETDTLSLFVEHRVERLRARAGRDLTVEGNARERAAIVAAVRQMLATRYARHLRS